MEKQTGLNMEWTGERMLPDEKLGLGAIEHLHRYASVLELAKDKTVLDIASGEGYGSALLASNAKEVYGVDISAEAVSHSLSKYKENNLKFLTGSVTEIPLPDNSIDVVICFETIEHVLEQEAAFAEFKRVLKADGVLVISTPAKENYEELHHDNPYHLRELSIEEFMELCGKYFQYHKLYHQRYIESSFIFPHKEQPHKFKEFEGSFSSVSKAEFNNSYYYNIVVCSVKAESLPFLDTSFFNGMPINSAYHKHVMERAKDKIIKNYETSASYRIGKMIVQPFSFFKRLIKS